MPPKDENAKEVEKERLERANKCLAEIKTALEKHSCKVDVSLTISTNPLKGNQAKWEVVPK